MEVALVEWFIQAPYIVSFLAGILTFLSPCVLPLIPAYLSYVSGVSLGEIKRGNSLDITTRWRIFRASLFFIIGFSLVFVLLGASMAHIVGNIFNNDLFAYIAGGVIVIFGLHVAKFVNIPLLNYEKRADISLNTAQISKNGFRNFIATYFAPMLLGISFSLGWTPCIGPIFAAIISMAASEHSQGIVLMSIYTAGLGVPFLLSALLVSVMLEWLNLLKAHMRVVEIVSGVLLIFIGILVTTGGIGRLSGYFLAIFS